MSAIAATILLEIAGRVGAPIVKGLLEEFIGGKAAEIGGQVIDTIAGHAGVPPEKLPDVSGPVLEAAVRATESEMPEILVQWNVQQQQAINLQLAEMNKNEAPWTWAWRPAGMWMFNALVVWYVVLVPMLNVVLRGLGASETIVMIVDVTTFVSLYITFAGLYMGGHTAKDLMTRWKAR